MRFRFAAALAILTIASVPGQAMAGDNQDACGAVLCLAGEAMGHGGGSACVPYLTKYFSILRFGFWGFKGGPTAAARMSFLNECHSADDRTKHMVNDRYGRMKHFP